MKNFQQLFTFDPALLLNQITRLPKLWKEDTYLRDYPQGPFHDTETIFLRFPPASVTEMEQSQRDQHECINMDGMIHLPAARQLIYSLMARVEGERLGRVMINKLRPGGQVYPHADTPSHADFFARLADIPSDRIGVVWLGAQDDVFGPHPEVTPTDRRVVFHGTFIALQGIETIIRAAKLLESDGIAVRVIGSGQDQDKVDRLLRELEPANVELTGLLPLEEIPLQIAEATVCLGIFGESGKAHRVVPNKLYECLAVGRPVVTADTEGARSAFTTGEVAMVAAEPEALAAELRRLVADSAARELLAREGHCRYVAQYSEGPLSRLLNTQLAQAISDRQ